MNLFLITEKEIEYQKINQKKLQNIMENNITDSKTET